KITRTTWAAIQMSNDPPRLYRHGSVVARIEENHEGTPVAQQMNIDRMRGYLGEIIRWEKSKKDEIVLALPPMHVVRNILATANTPLPILECITRVPIFASTGELQMIAGYNQATKNIASSGEFVGVGTKVH